MSIVRSVYQSRRIATALSLFLLWLMVNAGNARDIADATGRHVTIPDAPTRVFAAEPSTNVLLYALKPEAMVGWVRAPRAGDLPYLLDSRHSDTIESIKIGTEIDDKSDVIDIFQTQNIGDGNYAGIEVTGN